jgi:hypothetical protein
LLTLLQKVACPDRPSGDQIQAILLVRPRRASSLFAADCDLGERRYSAKENIAQDKTTVNSTKASTEIGRILTMLAEADADF